MSKKLSSKETVEVEVKVEKQPKKGIKPLLFGDYVKIKDGFYKDQIGRVVGGQPDADDNDAYWVELINTGWVKSMNGIVKQLFSLSALRREKK